MSFSFEIGDSPPSLTGSNSIDRELEEIHRLCSFELSLSQVAERRKNSMEQDQNDNHSITFSADAPEPKFVDFYVSSMLPSELHYSPSTTMNYYAVEDTDDNCNSGALSHAEKQNTSSAHQHEGKTLLGNHCSVKSSRQRRQLFADKVKTSIGNLQLLHDKISNMVALDADGCGDSEGVPEGEKRNPFSPKHQGTVNFENSVSNFHVSNRSRQFSSVPRLEVECAENPIAGRAAHDETTPDEGSWHWTSQTAQECLTETFTTESTVSRVEEGGESEYNGGKRSASRVDLEDLLSSLQALLSVLKKHEENEQILRAKMQVLRERKQALHEEKQRYKRQRNSECRSPLSQETVHLWLAERD